MSKTSTIIIAIIILIIIAVGVYLLVKPGAVANTNLQSQTPSLQSQAQSTASSSPTSYNIQGMKIDILNQGSGVAAQNGDAVTVNYTGTLTDGTKFDSSLNPGRTPFQFTLGQNSVIQGWEMGVLGMKVGEKRRLTIPPELGYGAQGAGGVIPPNATLIFEIDLLAINGK